MPAFDLIQYRRGTAAAWTTANSVLAAGEPGFETDTGRLKVGDGTKAWNALAYVGNVPTYKIQEVLNPVTSANNILTLGAAPVTRSLMVFVNGLLRTDYTLSGKVATFTKSFGNTAASVAVFYETTEAPNPPASTLSGNLSIINDPANSFGADWVQEGTWIANGVFRQENKTGGPYRLRWKDVTPTNATFETKIRFPTTNQTTGDLYAGILWTQTTGGAGGMLLRIQRVSGAWAIQWEVESTQATKAIGISALAFDTFHTLRGVRSGNTITCFLNGTEIGPPPTSSASGNTANVPALYSYLCIAEFDDVYYAETVV